MPEAIHLFNISNMFASNVFLSTNTTIICKFQFIFFIFIFQVKLTGFRSKQIRLDLKPVVKMNRQTHWRNQVGVYIALSCKGKQAPWEMAILPLDECNNSFIARPRASQEFQSAFGLEPVQRSHIGEGKGEGKWTEKKSSPFIFEVVILQYKATIL